MAYFPNGIAGEYLDAQCATCPAGKELPNGGGCPIVLIQMTLNYKQLNKGNEDLKAAMNVLIDEGGNCQMRPLIVSDKPKDDVPDWLK